jgi:cytochrome oxidase Cu insertion factor (SCO1/SenC/PrrC family)
LTGKDTPPAVKLPRSILFVPLAIALAAAGCAETAEPLPILYPVPDVALFADDGNPMATGDLRGNVVVYSFIFTRCGATCPMMTRAMKKLTTRFDDEAPIRFVSVSVDPAHDTPEVLRAYAAKHREDDRWVFLTGEREDVIGLSIDGFKLAAGEPGEGLEPILHSTKFILVDREGQIRAYYDGGDPDEIKTLERDAKRLLRE